MGSVGARVWDTFPACDWFGFYPCWSLAPNIVFWVLLGIIPMKREKHKSCVLPDVTKNTK